MSYKNQNQNLLKLNSSVAFVQNGQLVFGLGKATEDTYCNDFFVLTDHIQKINDHQHINELGVGFNRHYNQDNKLIARDKVGFTVYKNNLWIQGGVNKNEILSDLVRLDISSVYDGQFKGGISIINLEFNFDLLKLTQISTSKNLLKNYGKEHLNPNQVLGERYGAKLACVSNNLYVFGGQNNKYQDPQIYKVDISSSNNTNQLKQTYSQHNNKDPMFLKGRINHVMKEEPKNGFILIGFGQCGKNHLDDLHILDPLNQLILKVFEGRFDAFTGATAIIRETNGERNMLVLGGNKAKQISFDIVSHDKQRQQFNDAFNNRNNFQLTMNDNKTDPVLKGTNCNFVEQDSSLYKVIKRDVACSNPTFAIHV